jgi:methionyl-tRNA synthetase
MTTRKDNMKQTRKIARAAILEIAESMIRENKITGSFKFCYVCKVQLAKSNGNHKCPTCGTYTQYYCAHCKITLLTTSRKRHREKKCTDKGPCIRDSEKVVLPSMKELLSSLGLAQCV